MPAGETQDGGIAQPAKKEACAEGGPGRQGLVASGQPPGKEGGREEKDQHEEGLEVAEGLRLHGEGQVQVKAAPSFTQGFLAGTCQAMLEQSASRPRQGSKVWERAKVP